MEYRTYGEGDRTYVRAQQAWLVLTSYVQYRLNLDGFGHGVITHQRLGNLMGIGGQMAGMQTIRPVRHIFRFCKANRLPLLSAMVVRSDTGLPGWDYAVPNEAAIKQIQAEVLEFGWFSVRPPATSVFKKHPLVDEEFA